MLCLYRMSHIARALKAFPRHAPYSSWRYHKMVIGSLKRDPEAAEKLIESLRKERCRWPGVEERTATAYDTDPADRTDAYNDRMD